MLGGDREVVGRPHLIILKTCTLKWYILTLFGNVKDKFENKRVKERVFLPYLHSDGI